MLANYHTSRVGLNSRAQNKLIKEQGILISVLWTCILDIWDTLSLVSFVSIRTLDRASQLPAEWGCIPGPKPEFLNTLQVYPLEINMRYPVHFLTLGPRMQMRREKKGKKFAIFWDKYIPLARLFV